MVSTDKAVNPTNIMVRRNVRLKFTCRPLAQTARLNLQRSLGNVLRQRRAGDVIPIFKEQIKNVDQSP